MERVMGIDVEELRGRILAVAQPAYAVGAQRVSKGGVTYHFGGDCVTTVDASHSPQTSLRRAARHTGHGPRQVDRYGGKGNARRPDDPNWREELP
jgi:hypothetical protein